MQLSRIGKVLCATVFLYGSGLFGQTSFVGEVSSAQTISFDAIPNQILGVSPFAIVAQASSGLPVTIVSNTTSVCTTSGTLVMLVTAGTCSITASQPGNGSYLPATPVTKTFTISVAHVSGSFTAAPGGPFAAGTYPFMAAVGDFNNDGIQDLVASDRTGNISVLLGNGSGGFTAATGSPFTTGVSGIAIGIVVGDFNGDGNQDIAVANYQNSTITVMLGNGTGALAVTSGSPISTGSFPAAMAIGDFNGDGRQDLAVANFGYDNVSILLGDGQGGFNLAGTPVQAGAGAGGLAVGDFNGDGIQDLAVADVSGSAVTILLGNGSGGFTATGASPIAVGSVPLGVVTGDFNRDGHQDIAVSNQGDDTVTVLLGNGAGVFTAASGSPFAVGLSPYGLVAGDFNGDGIQDLATADYSAYNVTLLLGSGSGAFTIASISPLAVGAGPGSVAVGDFNHDGITDIATANGLDSDITVLLGYAPGSTAQMITFGAIGSVSFGASPITVNPTSNSGLAVSLVSAAPAVCTVSGYTITIVAGGKCSVVASQQGNATYAAAATVTQSFTVSSLSQTISFGPLGNQSNTAAPFGISATASSGLTVSFTSNTPTFCTVNGSTVSILGSGGCSITATQAGNADYSAAAPVTQKFTILFNDVSSGATYYNEVNTFAQFGITNGCGSNDFCPDADVTRDEMAIFIVRAVYGNDNFTYNTTPYFTDVTPSTFGFKWIQKLKDLGITSGCTATTYCPGETVTRDQMAIFIIRARLGLYLAGPSPLFTYPSTPYFTDATSTNEFAFPWIQRMRLESITSGCTATTYCSSEPVTRGEMAVFIMRGAFNQYLPAGTPILTQISPGTLSAGASDTFTITGSNTHFVQGTTQISPIPGVTIGTITVSSATSMTVQLTASTSAVKQPYSILAITGSEQAVLPNGLVIQ